MFEIIAITSRIVREFVSLLAVLDAYFLFRISAPLSIQKVARPVLGSISQDLRTELEVIERDVLNGSDENVRSFQKACLVNFNMTATAGAIVAQVAITSLFLPHLSQAHWATSASLIVSLVGGLLAVYFAATAQSLVAMRSTPKRLRSWLRGAEHSAKTMVCIRQALEEIERKSDGETTETMKAQLKQLAARLTPHGKASLWPAALLITPSLVLNIAIASLLVALGLYIGYVWTRNLDGDAGRNDWRNLLIVYTLTTGGFVSLWAWPAAFNDLERDGRHEAKRYQRRIQAMLEKLTDQK